MRSSFRLFLNLATLMQLCVVPALAQSYSCSPTFYPGGSSTWPPAPLLNGFCFSGFRNACQTTAQVRGGQYQNITVFTTDDTAFGCDLRLPLTLAPSGVVTPPYSDNTLPVKFAGGTFGESFSFFAKPVTEATLVTITIRSTNGATKQVMLTVLPPACTPPTINQHPANQTIDPGQSASVSVGASGTAPLSYQWFKDGATVVGATSATYTTGPLTANASVYVRVTNSCGSINSNPATVTIRCTAPAISSQPSTSTPIIAAGSGASVSVNASGSTPLTYEWYEGASPDVTRPLGTTTSTTFVTPKLFGGDKTLWVRVRNGCGSVDSVPVTVRMKCTLNVSPRFLQSDPPWQSSLYNSTQSTINDLGSALTSFAMALRFARAASINTPSTKSLDPGTLNDFLNLLGTSGYDASANVLFLSAAQFVGLDQKPLLPLTFTTLGATDNGFDSITSPLQAFGALDASLCADDPYPVIARVRSTRSGQYPASYVLVTGRDINSSGTLKYLIADPGGFGADLNSAPYLDFQGRPEFRTRGAAVRVNSLSNQSAFEIATGDTVDFVVIDASGRRTGLDSASGKHVANIPRSSNNRDVLSNNLTGAIGRFGHSVQVLQPASGPYQIVATGLSQGAYEVSVHAFKSDGKAQAPVKLKGNVVVGSSITFTLNYSSSGSALDIRQVVGDLNADSRVDCADVAIVRASFGKKPGQPGFDPRADVTADNVVDVRDLLVVTQQVPAGTTCGPTLAVIKAGPGSGEVISEPSGINCGAACSAQFKEQSPVTLTAKPAANSTFAGWSGACAGSSATTVVVMSSDRSCSARFDLILKTLTVSTIGGGSVRSTPGGIDCYPTCSAQFPITSTVTLAAIPGQFSVFKSWSGDCIGAAPSTTVTMSSDKNCAAVFESEPLSVVYQAHVGGVGWMTEVSDGAVAGTTGQSRQMEAIKIRVSGQACRVTYQAHVGDVGWLPEVSDGAVAGTTGQSRRMEALRIRLVGCDRRFHIIYQAHVQNIGWLPEVADGAIAGTVGQSRRMEAVRIRFVFLPGGV